MEQEGEPYCFFHVGAGGGALLYLPCWSRRENPVLSFLVEQEGKPVLSSM
jgi:hypothetical protein